MAKVINGRMRFNLYFPEKLGVRVKSEADELGVSANAYIVTLLSQYYNGIDAAKNTDALKTIFQEFQEALINSDTEKLEKVKANYNQLNFFDV